MTPRLVKIDPAGYLMKATEREGETSLMIDLVATLNILEWALLQLTKERLRRG